MVHGQFCHSLRAAVIKTTPLAKFLLKQAIDYKGAGLEAKYPAFLC